jgi:hypothetical protein
MSARGSASELARRLARAAEAACRHYLPKGRRQGNYWIVGDAAGSRGRSLFVRLKGSENGKAAAGKWTKYVARKVMLRICAWTLSCRGLAASRQHNVSAREVA